jgi:hypothetical protein
MYNVGHIQHEDDSIDVETRRGDSEPKCAVSDDISLVVVNEMSVLSVATCYESIVW